MMKNSILQIICEITEKKKRKRKEKKLTQRVLL